MILSLSVKNMALIESAEVELGKGLNVFTGETGAGKSLVIGSVNLALGGRAKGDIARDENAPVEIEMVFQTEDAEKLNVLSEMDIPVEDDGLIIIRRKIEKGRNSARINGHTVTNSQLREISALLLDLHAQSEHQSLLHEKNHLLILDRYGGEELDEIKSHYQEKYLEYRRAKEEYESLNDDEAERKREMDLLNFEVDEIQKAALKAGEDEELEEAFRLMNNSKKITDASNETYSLVSSENEGASVFVERALRTFAGVSEYDRKAEILYNELNDIDSLIKDFLRDVQEYTDSLKYSEEEFKRVSDRLDLINGLKLKYGRSISDIQAALDEKERRLSILENHEAHKEKLKDALDKAFAELGSAGDKLTGLRKRAGQVLSCAMQKGLKELNFNDSRFEIPIEDSGSYGPDGKDRVFFMISTNPGEELKPLKDVASGGELSRIMLALKTVLADTDEIETLIFDEIDSGISGRTAQKVSESLLALSGSHQVLLITHLPQIAAMADSHYLIKKEVEDGRTRTTIEDLGRDEMIGELSRMLSGASETERVRENAREMKDLADKEKKEIRRSGL